MVGRTDGAMQQLMADMSQTKPKVENLARNSTNINQILAVVAAILSGHDQAYQTQQQALASVAVLEQISQAINTIHQMNEQISHAVREQSQASDEISHNICNIRGVSHSIIQGADSSAHLSEQLSTLAERQHALVGQFKI